MLVTLLLVVTITLPGQGPSKPVLLRFPQPSLKACQDAGQELEASSDGVRKFSFSCEVSQETSPDILS